MSAIPCLYMFIPKGECEINCLKFKHSNKKHHREVHIDSIHDINHNEAMHEKPDMSYATLITEAIMNCPEKKLSLKDIYISIMNKYPYYSRNDKTWQNSIRHNLSLNKAFYKVQRSPDNPGKGALWCVNLQEISISGRSRKSIGKSSKLIRQVTSTLNEQHIDRIQAKDNSNIEFLDYIGVSDISQPKSVETSVFHGNLASLDDHLDLMLNSDGNIVFDDKQKVNSIFTFG
ncbi:Fork head like protein 2 [Astathelohania contejeani]|uniref:Fork head like protein 2 n=1 Tax=Astathelohania contejeani TaxID=164912 RepID=A0ABQ7I213_9MICR|nr:Fork head like protein 2 [Thelohania contejeani]